VLAQAVTKHEDIGKMITEGLSWSLAPSQKLYVSSCLKVMMSLSNPVGGSHTPLPVQYAKKKPEREFRLFFKFVAVRGGLIRFAHPAGSVAGSAVR